MESQTAIEENVHQKFNTTRARKIYRALNQGKPISLLK